MPPMTNILHMLNSGLHIVKGPIRTGKTTALKTWVAQAGHAEGILTPDGDKGLRLMYDIGLKAYYPFEMSKEELGESVNIGRFRFRKEAFNRGNSILKNTITTTPEVVVIDEWGKLEKRGVGLAAGCDAVITAVLRGTVQTVLVVVVRDSLYDDFIVYCESLIPKVEWVCRPSILHLPS